MGKELTEFARAGGNARRDALTAEERTDAARNAVKARWLAYYRRNPEKLKARRARERAALKRRAA